MAHRDFRKMALAHGGGAECFREVRRQASRVGRARGVPAPKERSVTHTGSPAGIQKERLV